MDESGDLGFNFKKKRTSRYFVVTFLCVARKGPVEKIVKKVFHRFSKAEIKRHHGVLHCTKEHPRTRMQVLQALSQKDVTILTVYLNKKKVYTRLHDEKHVLYNYVTNILMDRLYSKKLMPTHEPIHLIASRRETNQFLNDNFKDYLSRQVKENHQIKMDISIKMPSAEKCLQLADFVSWAIFRKWEANDESYCNLIRHKIVEESPLFP